MDNLRGRTLLFFIHFKHIKNTNWVHGVMSLFYVKKMRILLNIFLLKNFLITLTLMILCDKIRI